jgi:hypothetical protein
MELLNIVLIFLLFSLVGLTEAGPRGCQCHLKSSDNGPTLGKHFISYKKNKLVKLKLPSTFGSVTGSLAAAEAQGTNARAGAGGYITVKLACLL